jgi:hypothetical protein
MKTTFFVLFLTLTANVLFALDYEGSGNQQNLWILKNEVLQNITTSSPDILEFIERSSVTGGIVEVDMSAWCPNLIAFIKQAGDRNGKAYPPENDGDCSPPYAEIYRVFRQTVSGIKYTVFGTLACGELAVFIVHQDISEEFLLLDFFEGTNVFDFFASYFLTRG